MRKYYKYRKRNSTYIELMFSLLILLYLDRKVLDGRYEKMFIILAFTCGITMCFGIAFKIVKKNIERKRYVLKRHCEINAMTGEEFELFLKAHFEKHGYFVKTTPKSNDYGVDLICKKGGYKMVIQAKRYKGKVGIGAVQQIIGGMKYYDCNVGIVATNSYFTSNAWELAKRSGVMLWDRNKITEVFNIQN